MSASVRSLDDDREARAALSRGESDDAVHSLVERVVSEQRGHGICVDVGCGAGALARRLTSRFERYIGLDLVSYGGFPEGPSASFVRADLNVTPFPLEAAIADVVLSVETIEHIENPRAFVRELVRLAKPGGLVLVTTPNQQSALSLATLFLRGQFNAFQEAPGLYPAHITALLESDLRRIAKECGLEGATVRYTGSGRIPGTRLSWPSWAGLRGRAFSDNVLLYARKPGP